MFYLISSFKGVEGKRINRTWCKRHFSPCTLAVFFYALAFCVGTFSCSASAETQATFCAVDYTGLLLLLGLFGLISALIFYLWYSITFDQKLTALLRSDYYLMRQQKVSETSAPKSPFRASLRNRLHLLTSICRKFFNRIRLRYTNNIVDLRQMTLTLFCVTKLKQQLNKSTKILELCKKLQAENAKIMEKCKKWLYHLLYFIMILLYLFQISAFLYLIIRLLQYIL